MRITGKAVAQGRLETPAENFEETYQIKYQTEITQTLFLKTETWVHRQTIWFAPHVGIVKTENEDGEGTVLIAYSLAPTKD